jgi:hypothetical protein
MRHGAPGILTLEKKGRREGFNSLPLYAACFLLLKTAKREAEQ